MKKLLALLLALVMVVALVACGENKPNEPVANETDKPVENPTDAPVDNPTDAPVETEVPTPTEVPDPDMVPEFDVAKLASLEYDKDYCGLYEKYGADINIADVMEDEDGMAYIEKDGVKYTLGMDFLSMAMVYNTEPGGDYATSNDVYAAWWRYYITRWNYLLPEIPLYSNEYYDLYNTQIQGVEEHPTNPYWSPCDALIDWTSAKEDKSIILGNSTELSGHFRVPAFGKTNPAASDNDVGTMTTGLGTVERNKEGGYDWNPTVVVDHTETVDADGNKEFRMTIAQDLKFSDGSPITAKDYIASTLASLTPVYTEAADRESSGVSILGWEKAYQKYTGPDSAEGVKELAGIRLYGDYEFSIIVPASQLPYFYDITYAAFNAQPKAAFIGDADIMDDGNGCYLSDSFYAKEGDNYVQAAAIKTQCTSTDKAEYDKYPWSGPFMVDNFDVSTGTATLVKNPYYKGNFEGTVPAIERVIYKKVVPSTQLEDFKAGGLDIIAAITGGAETDEALSLVESSAGKYATVHYSRAGYGKLGFRADYGPVQFVAVRQAIAYCMDRAQFAKDFTGGYGGVVDGPYYTGSWMYKEAVAQGMMLDTYATSADSAIEVLEAGGWIYNENGEPYESGIRYKKIPADLIDPRDIDYKSQDGAYKTVKIGDDYYMPLVINWYGTTDNPFTDQLQTGFRENANVEACGMKVYNQLGDFQPMLDELYQEAAYGYYSGTPMYCAFNFATGFSSAIYDYAYNWSIEPNFFANYSACYLKDYADIYWMN